MKRKVCVLITARPSYSRIKTALQAIRNHAQLELQLVVAGSALLDRYGNIAKAIKQDGFDVAAQVYMVLEGESPTAMAKTTGLGILEISNVFDNLKPDVVVTVADRYETLATAVAASYMNIPVAHVQGGEVSGSIDEKVRHAVTKLSDLHFVASEKAKDRVLRMGENPSRVFVTGCPSIDLAREVIKQPELNFNPFQKYGGVGSLQDLSQGYVVVMQHPVTTEYQAAKSQAQETLYAVSELNLPVLWFWPNIDAGADGTSKAIRIFRETERQKAKPFHFFKNMMPEDFLKLLVNSRCLIGNSSVAIRECSFLGVPAVNIGSRQAGRERGKNVMDAGYARKEILKTAVQQIKNKNYPSESIYGHGDAGQKIADLLSKASLSIEKKLAY